MTVKKLVKIWRKNIEEIENISMMLKNTDCANYNRQKTRQNRIKQENKEIEKQLADFLMG